jgi:hypothetical protein
MFPVLLALIACPGSTTPSAVGNAISDSAACVIDVIEDVTMAVDIGKTVADCKVAATDIYNIATSLLTNMPEAGSTVTTQAGKMVARAEYVSRITAWQAAAKAAK